MTMTMLWEPIKEGLSVGGDYVSDDLNRLAGTFGGPPVELTSEHVFALRAMASASGKTVYSRLADLVDEHGPIRVWGQH